MLRRRLLLLALCALPRTCAECPESSDCTCADEEPSLTEGGGGCPGGETLLANGWCGGAQFERALPPVRAPCNIARVPVGALADHLGAAAIAAAGGWPREPLIFTGARERDEKTTRAPALPPNAPPTPSCSCDRIEPSPERRKASQGRCTTTRPSTAPRCGSPPPHLPRVEEIQ